VRRTGSAFLLALACTKSPVPDVSSGKKVDPPVSDPAPRVRTSVKFDVGLPDRAEAPQREASPPDPRPTRTAHLRCGEASRAQAGEVPTLRATGKAGAVELTLSGYRSYCSPDPVFSGGMAGEVLVVTEEAPTPGTPIARCTCLHDLKIEVSEVPPGEHPVEVYSRPGQGDPGPLARAAVTVPGG
jgi:hypothetical protein